jgi:hypothetical protein
MFWNEYANNPNSAGIYNRREIIPTADRFSLSVSFGPSATIKKDNQLRNL